MEAFKDTGNGYFPNKRQAVLPVTTSASERSSSTIKIIESCSRMDFGSKSFKWVLVVFSIHCEINIRSKDVLDLFAK